MGVETANIVLVVIIVIIFFMLLSACCRQLRNAYEDELTIEEMNRRRQTFMFGDDASHLGDEESSHSVRVTAISAGGGDRVFGVYEIRMPRRGFFSRAVAPPPPFAQALQNSSPIFYIDPEEPPPSYDEYLKNVDETESTAQNANSVYAINKF
ncbi:uncharacterized protein LOC110847064 [Folsomia candida]|uniref:Uncharacterized protein n=1 Tax=Folsomia candida TaxID=158441 RepID=A0A226EM50_FOLCA|nr:uncharacterized protein LOC110847064 [Folsomia candida]OXA58227.1 hypothetical protein Fcan01_06595 [Folsomia candida]